MNQKMAHVPPRMIHRPVQKLRATKVRWEKAKQRPTQQSAAERKSNDVSQKK
jgi:hypothetical protein